ncbi:glycosyltransferase family 2 protein [Paenibacillus sp. VCA1]|uniref:glycosyltransferase family 2 protein n=1 Tax=Paenibacillus sp. VCA1 TaxID=3039148 RepID=UPI002872A693|nr:glycosyltransferase family 2 protein [Paenibacillus sp. VCA1]MDR9854411.1 glycosyltransferase family 2 protein [Paenibacillus sp. VCA1]
MYSNDIEVSVIIPYYNSEMTIERALMSVYRQTFRQPIEIILINDGSTDRSPSIVESFIRQHPEMKIKHLEQVNSGPSRARNKGLDTAEGKYAAFLDSDDTWSPEKLEVQTEFMNKHPEVAISGTNYFINSDETTKYGREENWIQADFKRMLFKVFFCMSTVMVKRSVMEENRFRFLEGKHYGEDLLFFLQIVRRYPGARLSKPLAKQYKFLYGQGGLTQNLRKLLVHDLDNVRILYRQNGGNPVKIGFLLHKWLFVYSFLKHVVRLYKSRKYRKPVKGV